MLYQLGEQHPQLRGTGHYIAANATVIGQVVLEADVSIWFNTVIRGDTDLIHIGQGSNVQDGSILHTDAGIQLRVGAHVTIGHGVVLHGCEVGKHSLIGIRSVILNNATIGRECIIGANTLIPEGKVIPDGSLVVGSPGRVVRQLHAAQRQRLRAMAEHYVANGQRFAQQLSALPDA